jgi:hypothetical protein
MAPKAETEIQERQRRIRKLQANLRRFQSIPAARREAEGADEGEETCRALLRELAVEV